LTSSGFYSLQAPMIIGMHCERWRGVARVTMRVFAGAQDGGRLVMVWSPSDISSTGALTTTSFPSCMVDIGAGERECSLRVPWAAADRSLLVNPWTSGAFPKTTYSVLTFPGGIREVCNGFVYIVADTLFTSNQSTTGVGVKVFFPMGGVRVLWPLC